MWIIVNYKDFYLDEVSNAHFHSVMSRIHLVKELDIIEQVSQCILYCDGSDLIELDFTGFNLILFYLNFLDCIVLSWDVIFFWLIIDVSILVFPF
jgi:hypothetical protein